MITSIMMLTTTMVIMIMNKKTNPVKMSMMIMIFSSMIFWKMSQSTGTIWLPFIFFLLFMGGIIMMFMTLSSISPNESPSKMWKLTSILPIVFVLITWPSMSVSSHPNASMKWFMFSSSNLYIMMLIILTYFFTFLYAVSKEEGPLRTSLTC